MLETTMTVFWSVVGVFCCMLALFSAAQLYGISGQLQAIQTRLAEIQETRTHRDPDRDR